MLTSGLAGRRGGGASSAKRSPLGRRQKAREGVGGAKA